MTKRISEIRQIKLLKSLGWKMKYRHLKNKFGLCDFEKKEITIDVVSLIESTIIHEMAHAIHPDWSEKKVLSYEKRRYPKLSLRQKKELIKRFSTIKEEK